MSPPGQAGHPEIQPNHTVMNGTLQCADFMDVNVIMGDIPTDVIGSAPSRILVACVRQCITCVCITGSAPVNQNYAMGP